MKFINGSEPKQIAKISSRYFSAYIPAIRIALLYGAFAALWIIFSDNLIELLAVNKTMLSVLQTMKGLAFVVITTTMLYLLIQRSLAAQQQLIDDAQRNRTRLNLLLNTIPYGIQENDINGLITFSNNAHHKILDYPPNELINRYIWDFQVDNAHKQRLKDYLDYLIAEQPEPEPFVSINITRTGREVVIENSWDYRRDENGRVTGFISVISDITHRKEQEQKILHLAHYDSLTELPNRFLALDRLSQMLNEAERKHCYIAVLFLDLDNFKKINDSLGHDTGDKLLVEAAARLKKVLRQGDTVGRLGGDEFIVLLNDMEHPQSASGVIEYLLSQFRKPFIIEGRELVLTVSVGVALYPDDGDTPSVLLRNADSAMFYAKDNGRNNYAYFTRDMNQIASRRLALEEQLHGALDRNEFQLYFQPQIELKTGVITGAEALLRWHNSVLGDVRPDEFIQIAEQTGAIIPIGQFIVRRALELTRHWQLTYSPDFHMAINLSPAQFRDPNLVEYIGHAVKEAGIDPGTLTLEITEGVLLSGNILIDEALTALNDMGVDIAMDDFGTGYSSLSYLRRYPFDVIKIDRSFVDDIDEDPADRELISAMIMMAKGLNLTVVAEGVETEQQEQFLKNQSCDFAQGYFYSRPVSVEEFTKLLE